MTVIKTLGLTIFTSLSTHTFAESDLCQCAEFVYSHKNMKEFSTIDFTNEGPSPDDLSLIEKQQLIIAAKKSADSSEPSHSTNDAIRYFEESSSGNEFSLVTVGIHKAEFDVFSYYPGDNHYGFVFKTQTKSIVAKIQDGDFVCVK